MSKPRIFFSLFQQSNNFIGRILANVMIEVYIILIFVSIKETFFFFFSKNEFIQVDFFSIYVKFFFFFKAFLLVK